MGHVLIRTHGLGAPQTARDVFRLLADAGKIGPGLADALQCMVGFRTIAVHDYQRLQLPILVAVIEKHLDDFLTFSKLLVSQSP